MASHLERDLEPSISYPQTGKTLKDRVLHILSGCSYSPFAMKEKEGNRAHYEKTWSPGSRRTSQEGGKGIPLVIVVFNEAWCGVAGGSTSEGPAKVFPLLVPAEKITTV